MQTSLKSSPGSSSSSESVNLVGDESYNWVTATVEGLYSRPSWSSSLAGQGLDFEARLGAQHHTVPFLVNKSNGDYAIESRDFALLTAGSQVTINKKKRIYYEAFMRYQHPVYSGSGFDISPSFAFDGSVGAVYRVKAGWKLGAYWYGQWHKYDFTEDSIGGSGDQELFFSNIELRLGYDF